MPAARRTPNCCSASADLGQLVLDELRRAAPVRLGIDLPQDKRLRALCEAVLAEPTRHATLDGWAARSRRQRRAPWRGCSASSSARLSGRGASRCCWHTR